MFKNLDTFSYKYVPILALRPAEMNALEQLPAKDKDKMLPLIGMRGWVGSKTLENSISRVKDAIGERPWIVDIDKDFLASAKADRPGYNVVSTLKSLMEPVEGYKNWCEFFSQIPHAIPVLQIGDVEELALQIATLSSWGRGLVVRFSLEDIDSGKEKIVIDILKHNRTEDIFVLYDYGQVRSDILTAAGGIATKLSEARTSLPEAIFGLSSTSFPSGFSGYSKGENPIYERLLFNNVKNAAAGKFLLYSDRAGARATRNSGGGGVPSPRIDYPLTNDWRFIRKEFADSQNISKEEKAKLYTEAAAQIMAQDYWNPNLHVWGTQLIQLTSKSDILGISSPPRATAARLNIHMHNQLYYDEPENLLDTDEDWAD